VVEPAPPPHAAPSIATPSRPAEKPDKPREAKPATPQPAPASPAPAASPAAGNWFVQVGSFSQTDNAERYAQQLRKQGFSPVVLPPAGSKGLVRVRVGPVRSRDAAAALLERLTASGHKGAVVGS
jgi:cell division protein FtsN